MSTWVGRRVMDGHPPYLHPQRCGGLHRRHALQVSARALRVRLSHRRDAQKEVRGLCMQTYMHIYNTHKHTHTSSGGSEIRSPSHSRIQSVSAPSSPHTLITTHTPLTHSSLPHAPLSRSPPFPQPSPSGRQPSQKLSWWGGVRWWWKGRSVRGEWGMRW